MELHFFFILFVIAAIHALCPPGRYGNKCTSICGRCEGSSSCDPDTGQCSSGCQNGWQTDYCNISYPVLRDPPVLRNRSDHSITICWQRWTKDNAIGQGKPIAYVIQIKNLDQVEWRSVRTLRADEWSEKNDGFQEEVHGIRPEIEYQLRVLVVDESGITQWEGIPILIVSKIREVTQNDASNYDFGMMNYLKWMGIVAGVAFIIALCIVLGLECRRRQRLKAKAIDDGMMELSENYINNSRLGIDNAALVTLRRDADAKRNVVRNANDKMKSNQDCRWKEAVPGLSRATAPESWYTEWGHESRIYENEYKT